MFNRELGIHVDECKLRVSYIPPPQPPSSVREGSEEGSSPRASVLDNGTENQTSEFNIMCKGFMEQQESSSEVKALLSKLTEEKRSAIQQNNKLHLELEPVEAKKPWWGHPFHVRCHCWIDRHPVGVSLEENMIDTLMVVEPCACAVS